MNPGNDSQAFAATEKPRRRRTLRVVVASGKGGTGKTLVSSQLARWLSQRGVPTTYVDADAEAPNGHVVLQPEIESFLRARSKVASVDVERCNGCGICVSACAFEALLPGKRQVHQILGHCRGCGACSLVCPRGAISEREREVGSVLIGTASQIQFLAGVVDIGERRAVPVIEAAIEMAVERDQGGIVVIDGPPGNACPVMAALKQADAAVLVAEPTPFGAHDLAITADTCTALSVPVAVVLNRAGLSDYSLEPIVVPRQLSILSQIPFEPAIALAMAQGRDPLRESAALATAIAEIGAWVEERWNLTDAGEGRDGPSRPLGACA